ncbi:hypothetical protein GGH94_004111 [Coemansia aciculifera]|uniref:Cytokinin riboside 5'-monophosphate phosphoribohydrolase n=1 Tax=Coemansia aciculifera TaxID=417176 RepID=A0A9W8M5K0_9FUNG|nr:hypothetical protein GGH94_004111 [Coemansia aciculifera]KAJ2872608.1 hypothetical protein GGH93_003890 [Coemansia aciculifera]
MTLNNDNLVCVFCASHDSTNPVYNEAADALGRELVQASYGLVYGGGGHGLMGRVARGVFENNGSVLGIIPRSLTKYEGTTEIGRTILVDSMHERKQLMSEHAMAFIALPGGFGTLEELLEVATWSMLRIHSKPIIVLNTNGYYNALGDMIDKAVEAGFVKPGNKDIIVMCDTPKEAIAAIKSYSVPTTRYDLTWTAASPM